MAWELDGRWLVRKRQPSAGNLLAEFRQAIGCYNADRIYLAGSVFEPGTVLLRSVEARASWGLETYRVRLVPAPWTRKVSKAALRPMADLLDDEG